MEIAYMLDVMLSGQKSHYKTSCTSKHDFIILVIPKLKLCCDSIHSKTIAKVFPSSLVTCSYLNV